MTIPNVPNLAAAQGDIDKVIDATTAVLDFIIKYGVFFPQIAAEIPALQTIDNGLKAFKADVDKL